MASRRRSSLSYLLTGVEQCPRELAGLADGQHVGIIHTGDPDQVLDAGVLVLAADNRDRDVEVETGPLDSPRGALEAAHASVCGVMPGAEVDGTGWRGEVIRGVHDGFVSFARIVAG
jgi:hypothetical protein